jgi:(2Fe-2S) ferredoxin
VPVSACQHLRDRPAIETTVGRVWYGDVSKAQYADVMNSIYPVEEGSPVLECIYRQPA